MDVIADEAMTCGLRKFAVAEYHSKDRPDLADLNKTCIAAAYRGHLRKLKEDASTAESNQQQQQGGKENRAAALLEAFDELMKNGMRWEGTYTVLVLQKELSK